MGPSDVGGPLSCLEAIVPKLRNINPLGAVDLPLIGRSLEAGEEFDCTAEQAKHLLEQAGNYQLATDKKPSTPREKAAPKQPADEPKTSDPTDTDGGAN